MLGLVDYGGSSGSESGDESSPEDNSSDFVQNGNGASSSSIISRLPPPKKSGTKRPLSDDAEASFMSKQSWEAALAKEADAQKPKPRQKIFAFGALGKASSSQASDSEEEEEDRGIEPRPPPVKRAAAGSSELLRMLPDVKNHAIGKPKTKSTPIMTTLKPHNQLIPPSVTKTTPKPSATTASVAAKAEDRGSDSDDDIVGTDFFGFTTVEKPSALPEPAFTGPMPMPEVYDDEIMPGPSRPIHSSANELTEIPSASKHIGDEEAQRMIYQRELAPWGASDRIAREAVMNMVDVSVDQTLGPNIRETLLRNLNNKQMAQAAAGPLPNAKKDAKDRSAKQRNQITHLAHLAVAREEQLQEQWADSRAKKKASAQKYGF